MQWVRKETTVVGEGEEGCTDDIEGGRADDGEGRRGDDGEGGRVPPQQRARLL